MEIQKKTWNQPAARRTETVGFRLYRDQIARLNSGYKGKSSEIVRALLDKFLAGKIQI